MSEERRENANPYDVAGIVAVIYTLGFFVMAALLFFYPIPTSNKDALLYLFGILSGILLSIVAFYYGGSKAVEATQRATEQRTARSESVVQAIAKGVPAAVVAAANGAVVTPAPVNPETGVVPAKEVAT